MNVVGRSLLMFAVLLPVRSVSAEQRVAIRADYPGGNVIVVKNEGAAVQLAPDLRGGQPWFYWNFEAAAAESGKVTFTFAGSPIIGVRGPAYSVDNGKTWQFLGAEHCTYAEPATPAKERRETFSYEFKPERLKVRFAVAVPYLPENLKEFVAARAGNPHLKQEVLTKSRGGVPVEMLVVGAPGPERASVLVTARHHACESMASYVLEGFLDEAMSTRPAGIAFRERYALFAVPLVDRDGVAAGDQGKNRDPHDHNRDYGPTPLYPEIKAIQELGEAQDIRYSIDFHCPALRGDIHEAMHFLGLGVPQVKANLDRYIAWIKEERPQAVMTPLNYLTDPAKPNAVNPKINSHHFALRKNAVLAATLEVPYTQVSPPLDIDMAREYGRGLLRAWVRTKFESSDPTVGAKSPRGAVDDAEFAAFRTNFLKTYRSKPKEAEAAAQAKLAEQAPAIYRIEASILLAQLCYTQRRYAEALELCGVALSHPAATMQQRITASHVRLQALADDPATERATIEAMSADFLKIPYPANEQLAAAFDSAARFHSGRKAFDAAIELKRKQVSVAASHQTGKVLLELAKIYDDANQPSRGIESRKEAAALLRERLGPVPKRNIFAAMMTLDLFDAVCGIPTSSLAEKQAAAKLALEHEIVAPMYKDRVRRQLAELEKAVSN